VVVPSDRTSAQRDDLPAGYDETLRRLAVEIQTANVRAVRKVNAELITLYWALGRIILERQAAEGWGTKVIARLSADMLRTFPHMTGLSPRNMHYMQKFASEFPKPIAPQAVAQLPWGHVRALLDMKESLPTRTFYAAKAVEAGWSRAVLLNQIKGQLHLRAGVAASNFALALPPEESELVQQMVKDPYHFEFLTLASATERDVESGLVANLAKTLQELGVGFYYVGRQQRLVLIGESGEEQEFFLDLLFYHHYLRRFVVFELKIDEFKPEYAGKLNFYCNVVDDNLRHADGLDAPTIGILLCASKSNVVVDYSLRNLNVPLAVAQYTYSQLPQELRGVLPSPADLEPIATEAFAAADAANDESVGGQPAISAAAGSSR
jgi:predicted nuclease of restriction endonuclease-like (RecB) superfamily